MEARDQRAHGYMTSNADATARGTRRGVDACVAKLTVRPLSLHLKQSLIWSQDRLIHASSVLLQCQRVRLTTTMTSLDHCTWHGACRLVANCHAAKCTGMTARQRSAVQPGRVMGSWLLGSGTLARCPVSRRAGHAGCGRPCVSSVARAG